MNGEANEFEFVIKTIGQYTNYQLVYLACQILSKQLASLANQIESQIVPIHDSKNSRELGYTSVTVSSMENSYDIILEEQDYTLGFLLEHFLFTLFYDNEEDLSYIGFKKYHPHDDYSVIRMAFKKGDSAMLFVKQYLIRACMEAKRVLEAIQKKFHRGN
jgi:DNA-directed RNA polymerase subunit L